MRWFVEISNLGKKPGKSTTLCVEATQWQPALQRARALRGDEGPLSNFSIELLDDGYRAIDPSAKLKYVVKKAPDNAELSQSGGASMPPPAASVRPPAASTPPPAAASAPPPAASAPPPAPPERKSKPKGDKKSQTGKPPPVAEKSKPATPKPAEVKAKPGPSKPPEKIVEKKASQPPPRQASQPPPRQTSQTPPRQASKPPPRVAAVEAKPLIAIPLDKPPPPPAQPGLPRFMLQSQREEDPTARSPLHYREYVYVVGANTSEEDAERLVRDRFAEVKRSLESVRPGKLVNLAVFDHPFEGKPLRRPLVTLAWKDWRNEGPEVRRASDGVGETPTPLASAAKAPASHAMSDAPKVVITEPKPSSTPPAKAASTPPPKPASTPPVDVKTASQPPRPAVEARPVVEAPVPAVEVSKVAQPVVEPPAPAQKPASEPPPPAVAQKAASEPPPPAAAPKAASEPPKPAPADESNAVLAQSAEHEDEESDIEVETASPAPAVASLTPPTPRIELKSEPPPASFPTPSILPATPSFVPPKPVQPDKSQPPPPAPPPTRKTRLSDDDLISELFEAMSELHFHHDSLAGAEYVLGVALDKIPSEVGLVSFFDINKREFVVARQLGGRNSALGYRQPEKAQVAISAMRSKRAVLVNDQDEVGNAMDDRWFAAGVELRSLVCAPIALGGRYLGLIELANPADENPYREGDGNAMTYVGQQFGEFVAERGVVIDAEHILESAKTSAQMKAAAKRIDK